MLQLIIGQALQGLGGVSCHRHRAFMLRNRI
jgi:hypothetical protein